MAFPTGWGHKVAITINHTKINADLTDWTLVFDESFAAVLTQTNGPLDADGSRPSINGGGDIRFSADSAGSTRLAVDVRRWITENDSSAAECEIAVRVPTVSSSADTTIYMWWGASGETQPAAADTYGQYDAYDGNYVGVWPLNEDPSGTAPQVLDRTSDQNHGTSSGSMISGDSVDGLVGNALSFDGLNDRIEVGFRDTLTDFPAYTVSLSTYTTLSSQPESTGLFSSTDGGGGSETFQLAFGSSNNLRWQKLSSETVDFGSATADTWEHLAASKDGDNVATFRNGSQVNSGTFADGNDFDTIGFAVNRGVGLFYTGMIEEVRVSSVARSSAWINADHHNFMNTSGFLTWGTITDVSGGSAPVAVDIGAGALAIAQQPHLANAGVSVAAGSGAVSFAPYALAGKAGVQVGAGRGALTLAGQPQAVDAGAAAEAGAGLLAFTAHSFAATAGAVPAAGKGALSLTGKSLTIQTGSVVASSVNIQPGTLALSGNIVAPQHGASVDIAASIFALTGTAPEPGAGARVSAQTGAFTLTGQAADAGGGVVIDVEPGSVTLSGEAITGRFGHSLELGAATLTLTGQSMTVLNVEITTPDGRTVIIPLEARTVAVPGQARTLKIH